MTIFHITDYDNTIIPLTITGDDKNLSASKYRDFINNHKEIKIIYSSGRTHENVLECIEEFDLPKPEYIIGGVGTEIYDFNAGKLSEEWSNIIKSSGFNGEKVKQIVKKHLDLDARPFSTEFKIYYHAFDLTAKVLDNIRNDFETASLNANVIYSRNKILDIVPNITDKGKALEFILNKLNFPFNQVVISGDSLNDIDMFKEKFALNITPFNAESGLVDVIKDLKNHYHAKENYAEGVVSGLNYFLNKGHL